MFRRTQSPALPSHHHRSTQPLLVPSKTASSHQQLIYSLYTQAIRFNRMSMCLLRDEQRYRSLSLPRRSNCAGHSCPSFRYCTHDARKQLAPASPQNDVLNPCQTLEWKGWMMVGFLSFRFGNAIPLDSFSMDAFDFDVLGGSNTLGVASSTPALYTNLSRVPVSMFLFLTGYIHTMFFYTKNDYSLPRVLRTLFRFNFLAFFLCLTHDNPYIFYYICPLHSYFYLLCYVSFKAHRELNYQKLSLRFKLLGLACFLFLMWDVNTPLFKILHLPFFTSGPAKNGAPRGPLWEWYFRTALDHWSAFLGMVFALNQPIVSLMMRKIETFGLKNEVLGKAAIGTGLLISLILWLTGPLLAHPRSYGSLHAYFGVLPVLAYIFFRNISTSGRNRTIYLFQYIGEFVLEAYLLQHHVLFCANGRKVLTIIPGWPKINWGLCLMACLYLSRKVYQLTLSLRDVLLPVTDERLCGRTVGVIALFVSSFYAMSVSLTNFGMLSLGSVAVITVICGILIYQTILDMTWRRYTEARKHYQRSLMIHSDRMDDDDSDDDDDDDDPDNISPVGKISPPIIATLIVFLLGLLWHTMALTGAGKMQPLPPNCAIYANDGKWIEISLCSAYHRGTAYRQHAIDGGFRHSCFQHNTASSDYTSSTSLQSSTKLATGSTHLSANANLVWGWYDNPSNSLCRFSPRTAKDTLPSLFSRNLIFIGDGMIKSLFHSFSRVLLNDDQANGHYDATIPKHSDITKYFDSVKIQYKWAPLAMDQLENLRELREYKDDGGPDIVILGGGAWDRLHVWATDEDQDSLKATIIKLTKEMEKLKRTGVPVIWMIPTTINTKALNQEEKRTQMSEEAVQQMRDLYASLGVLGASTFVLDGRVFTQQRVEESFDGMHYPPAVYDAGVQILANAMDWIFPQPEIVPGSESLLYGQAPPEPGLLSNTSLGLMMLCFIFIGLFFFDGLLGFSYLGSLLLHQQDNIMPSDLYEEAFYPIHARWKLPMTSFWMQEEGKNMGLTGHREIAGGDMRIGAGTGSAKRKGDSSRDGMDLYQGLHELELAEERHSR